jgi:hypothetical protein
MDARRIRPTHDGTDLTICQVADLVARPGNTAVAPVFCLDAGYDPIALTDGLADVPANIVVADPRRPGLRHRPHPTGCRHAPPPRRHGQRCGAPSPIPGPPPTRRRRPPTAATAPCTPSHGTDCTRDSVAVDTGPTTSGHRSWPAP